MSTVKITDMGKRISALTDRIERDFSKSTMAIDLASRTLLDAYSTSASAEALDAAEARLIERLTGAAPVGRSRNRAKRQERAIKRTDELLTAIEEGRPLPKSCRNSGKKRRRRRAAP